MTNRSQHEARVRPEGGGNCKAAGCRVLGYRVATVRGEGGREGVRAPDGQCSIGQHEVAKDRGEPYQQGGPGVTTWGEKTRRSRGGKAMTGCQVQSTAIVEPLGLVQCNSKGGGGRGWLVGLVSG